MAKNFRMDHRSVDQFAHDIKESTLIEKKLMILYVDWLNQQLEPGKDKYTFVDHGVDNSGKYLQDRHVNTNADFLLKRKGKQDRKIEIKFARKNIKQFRLKVHQVKSYIKKDVCVVNFVNVDNNPKFCILTPADLEKSLQTNKQENFYPWGNKPCVLFYTNHLTWYSPTADQHGN